MTSCPDCGARPPAGACHCLDCGASVAADDASGGDDVSTADAASGGDDASGEPGLLGVEPGSRADALATVAVGVVAGGGAGAVLTVAGVLGLASFAPVLPAMAVGIAAGAWLARLGTVREAVVRGAAVVAGAVVLAPLAAFGPGPEGGDAAGRWVLFLGGEAVALAVAVPLAVVALLARRAAPDGGTARPGPAPDANPDALPGAVDDCPACGGGLPATARFCAHCGVDLADAGDEAGASGPDAGGDAGGPLGVDPDGRTSRVATPAVAGVAGVLAGVVGTAAGVVATADGWSLVPGPAVAVAAGALAARQPTTRRAAAVGAYAVAVVVLLAPLALWGPAGETQPSPTAFLLVEAGAAVVAGAVALVGRLFDR